MTRVREFWRVQLEVVFSVGELGLAQIVEVDWEQVVVEVEQRGVDDCSIGGASYDETVVVGAVCAT